MIENANKGILKLSELKKQLMEGDFNECLLSNKVDDYLFRVEVCLIQLKTSVDVLKICEDFKSRGTESIKDEKLSFNEIMTSHIEILLESVKDIEEFLNHKKESKGEAK